MPTALLSSSTVLVFPGFLGSGPFVARRGSGYAPGGTVRGTDHKNPSDRPPEERAGGGGEEGEAAELFDLLYASLHRLAERNMAGQRPGHTLQPTALVNEVYVRLGVEGAGPWKDEAHFLTTAARAMRQVLVDCSRRRLAAKRGADARREPLSGILVEYFDRSADIEALDSALEGLKAFDPEMSRALDLRFFAGRTMEEIADVLNVPKRSLERRWAAARAWLYEQVR